MCLQTLPMSLEDRGKTGPSENHWPRLCPRLHTASLAVSEDQEVGVLVQNWAEARPVRRHHAPGHIPAALLVHMKGGFSLLRAALCSAEQLWGVIVL